MRILTPEQHEQIVEALESCTHSTNLSEGQEFDGDLVDEALAVLQALPELEVKLWQYTFLGTPETTRSDFSPFRLGYTPRGFIETALYATKEPS